MKISRRNVVKGLCSTVLAPAAVTSTANAATDISISDDSLSVQIAHKWGGESIVAVIKNKSDHSTTITDINSVAADYGRFDFAELTKTRPLTIPAGGEVHVPFTVMGTPAKPYGHFDNRLQKQLKRNLKISTAGQLTKVATSFSPKVV